MTKTEDNKGMKKTKEIMKTEATAPVLLKYVKGIIITKENVVEFKKKGKENSDAIKVITAWADKYVKPVYNRYIGRNDMKKAMLADFVSAKALYKSKLEFYLTEKKRKEREILAKEELARQKKEQKKIDDLKIRSKKWEKKDPEKAEMLAEQAETYVEPVTSVIQVEEKVKGVSGRTVTKATVTNKRQFLKAASAGIISDHVIDIDLSALVKEIDQKGIKSIPGISITYPEKVSM